MLNGNFRVSKQRNGGKEKYKTNIKRRRVSSMVELSSANPNVPGLIPARSHTGVMDNDEACFMHLTPGVVHHFPKAVSV